MSINFWVGLDFHKESVTSAAFRNLESEPLRVHRLSADFHKLHRLYTLFHRLAAKTAQQVAATAVAPEMIGFLWAVLCELDISALQEEVSTAA